MAAACAPAPEPTTTTRAAPTKGVEEETYTVGFASISEKYIEPVTVADVAVEGLKGFRRH